MRTKYSDSELLNLYNLSLTFKIQQKQGEWVSALSAINNLKKDKLSILEIGCCDGGTTISLAYLADNLTTIDCINPPLFDINRIKEQCDYRYFSADSHSLETKALVGDRTYDVLFIDGDHTYEGVKQDFNLYISLVNEGGLVIFHDIVESDCHKAINARVDLFWNEIKKDYKYDEFLFDNVENKRYDYYLPNKDEIKMALDWGGIGILYL